MAKLLFHTSRYDVHEKEVGEIALEMGFEQVSLSSTIMPMVRVVPRGYTGKGSCKVHLRDWSLFIEGDTKEGKQILRPH